MSVTIDSTSCTGYFALACCLLKSKPEGIEVKDYLECIRQSIEQDTFGNEHINHERLFKLLLNSTQRQILSLQMKVASLVGDILPAPTRKRKSRHASRVPTEALKSNLIDIKQLILYHLYEAKQELSVDPEQSCLHLMHCLRHLEVFQTNLYYIIFNWCNKQSKIDPKPDSTAFTRCIGLVLHILESLPVASTTHLSQPTARITSKLTTLFQTLLSTTTSVSLRGTLLPTHQPDPTNTAPAPASTSAAPAPASPASQATVPLTLPQRTSFLTILHTPHLHILTFLRPTVPTHARLFSAAAYLVIDRAAALVFFLTFGHVRGPTVQADIEADQRWWVEAEPTGTTGMRTAKTTATATTSTSTTATMKTTEMAAEMKLRVQAVGVEARALLPLLQAVVGMSSEFEGYLDGAPGRGGVVRETRKQADWVAVQERLQETLIKCLWDEERDESSRQGVKCLAKPVLVDDGGKQVVLDKSVSDAGGRDDDFVRQVWQLIGWDRLEK